MDMPEDHENLDKKELFTLYKEGEGSEYAEAIRKNVVPITYAF